MLLTELADYLKAQIRLPNQSSDYDTVISRIAPIQEAKEGEITFVSNPEYARYVAETKASAVILAEPMTNCHIPQLIHRNPYWAFAKVAQLFHMPARGPSGVSEHAFIAADAEMGDQVTIYPYCYVGSKVKMGSQVTLYPGVFLGDGCEIGDHVTIHANSVIYHDTIIGNRVLVHGGSVIGSDGFGFATGEGEVVKIPQIGKVIIEDDVEVGALTTIDRAAMGVTRIKRSTKLDSKVHIAHNVEVGEQCMLSAFTGIAGSTSLGNGVLMGGHSGAVGHIHLADGTKVGAMTGVAKDTEANEMYMGWPGIPAKQWRRQQVYLQRLSDYEKRLRTLEKKLSSTDEGLD